MMHLGFAAIESGFVQKKNVVNILFKNLMIISIGLITYYTIGFNLMHPGMNECGFFGFAGFGLNPSQEDLTSAYGDYRYWKDFIFQGMFAATCCTIVSGAFAERIKLIPFLICCFFCHDFISNYGYVEVGKRMARYVRFLNWNSSICRRGNDGIRYWRTFFVSI